MMKADVQLNETTDCLLLMYSFMAVCFDFGEVLCSVTLYHRIN